MKKKIWLNISFFVDKFWLIVVVLYYGLMAVSFNTWEDYSKNDKTN